MFNDIRGVVNGKTLIGTVGLIFFVVAMTIDQLPLPIPDLVLKIGATITLLLTAFGLFDAAQQELTELKAKIQAFIQSSPFVGIAVQIFLQFFEQILNMNLAPALEYFVHILSVLLIIFGIKGQFVKARKNSAPIPDEFIEKYRKAA